MQTSTFVIKCRNCHSDLNYTLLSDGLFECFLCKHRILSFYGVWHCPLGCDMDICPLCSFRISFLCKLCKAPISYFKSRYLQEGTIFKCNECLRELVAEDGGHRCNRCKKYFCCVECRSKQNDLYNRDSEFYSKDLGFFS